MQPSQVVVAAPSSNPQPLDSIGLWQIAYFEHEIMPRFSLRDRTCRIDAQWLIRDVATHQAVIALSNAHRVLKYQVLSSEYIQQSDLARTSAIRTFREQLFTGAILTTPEQAFSINVLLCVLDGIVSPVNQAALSHLDGGRAILESTSHFQAVSMLSEGLQPLLISIFATMDLTSCILNGKLPYLPSTFWDTLEGKEAWWSGLECEVSLLKIMCILSQLARLGASVMTSNSPAPMDELLSFQEQLDENVVNLRFRLHHTADESNTPTAVEIFCSAFRASASLYIYRALCNLPVHHPLVQDNVVLGIRTLKQAPRLGKLAHCLLFPILVVGAHSRTGPDQGVVLDAISFTSSYLSFGSVPLLANFLKDSWKYGYPIDISWWDYFQPLQNKAFFF